MLIYSTFLKPNLSRLLWRDVRNDLCNPIRRLSMHPQNSQRKSKVPRSRNKRPWSAIRIRTSHSLRYPPTNSEAEGQDVQVYGVQTPLQTRRFPTSHQITALGSSCVLRHGFTQRKRANFIQFRREDGQRGVSKHCSYFQTDRVLHVIGSVPNLNFLFSSLWLWLNGTSSCF
jgi:hypothetical protein